MTHTNQKTAEVVGRNQMADARNAFPNLTKFERFAALLAVIENQSPIPNPQSPL